MNARTNTWVGILVLSAVVIALAVVAMPSAASAMIASSANGLTLPAIGAVSSAVMPQIAYYQADEDPPENQPPPAASQPPEKKRRGWHRERRPFRPGEGPLPPSAEGRPREAGEGPPPGEPPMPPPEVIGQAMEVLRTRLPVFHQRMMRLREQHPVRFERMMHQVLPVMLEYLALRDRNPEVAETIIREFQIEDQLRTLSGKFRKAAEEPVEQAAIGQEIERLVPEQFELRFRRQAARLDEFERRLREQQQRLEEQRARLREDSERRADLVAKRVAEVKEGKIGDPFRGHRPGGPPGGFKRRPPFGPGDDERPLRLDPGRKGPPGAGRDREGPPGAGPGPGPGHERPPGAGPGKGDRPRPPGDDPDDPDEESEDE